MAPEPINEKVFRRFEENLERVRGKEIDQETKEKVNGTILKIKAGEAKESEIIDANKAMSAALKVLARSGHANDIIMGKPVMDAEGNRSSKMKRTVIVLDNASNIIYIKSGMDNHSILAGNYFREPGRHSFWYEFSSGNLVLHPAASEDKPRLDVWNSIFEDKDSGLKEQIKSNLRYFN